MAPKPKAKAATTAAAAEAISLPAASPCSQRGAEIPAAVFAMSTQRVQSWFMVCSSPARLRVSLSQVSSVSHGGTVLFDQQIPPPNPTSLDLNPLPPGRYVVHWAYIVTGPSWEVVAEIIVDGVTRFRKRNAATDSLPVNSIFAVLDIS